jgi:predicted phosphate transport protein (TIGR00153 family)
MMTINKFVKKLIPKHNNFYLLLEEDIQNLMLGGRTIREAFHFPLSQVNRQKLHEIEEIEHKGDMITHRLFKELGSSFITPFDREDIHLLAAAIDDVMDNIQGVAKRVLLYEIKSFPDVGLQIVETLYESINELGKVIPLLRNLDNKDLILEACVKINSCENKADDLFEHSVAHLFKACKDPIELIKTKEILMSLEIATDKCEDAANAIESIIIKNT